MILKRKILISILIARVFSCLAQERLDSFLIRTELDSHLISIHTDALGDVWKVYPKKIIRFSNNFLFSDSFSNLLLSSKTLIDAKFPLKTLFYYPEQNRVQILNSRWGLLSEIRLDFMNIFQPSAVAYCYDGTLLILDRNSNHLYKMNENGTKKFDIINPFNLGTKFFYPSQIIDYKFYLLAIDTSYGIFMIDNYGTLMSHFRISPAKVLNIERSLYVLENNKLFRLYINQDKVMTRSKNYISISEEIKQMNQVRDQYLIHWKSNKIGYYRNFETLFTK